MSGDSIIKIQKTSKNNINDVVSKKTNVENINFVREYDIDNQSAHFTLMRDLNWQEYEQKCRESIYEAKKFPSMGLSQIDLDYIHDMFLKQINPQFVAKNFIHKEETDIKEKKLNTYKSVNINKKSKNGKFEKSPFDKRR